MWYREVIGHNRCPIVDTWWQTETGHIMLTPIPGAIATKPGSATRPFPGVVPEIVTMDGKPVPEGSGGFLVLKQPWPGMLRTIYGDPDRYVSQYWSQIPPARTSPATALAKTKTAISGSWAAWTTSSTSPATA